MQINEIIQQKNNIFNFLQINHDKYRGHRYVLIVIFVHKKKDVCYTVIDSISSQHVEG